MKYGKINHVGIVVKDWNEATDRYGKLFGIKHWYEIVTDEGTFDLKYHGEKKDCKVRIFYGGKGTTKLEIIETQGEKNIYDYFYEKRGEAAHHLMYMTKDLDRTIKEFSENGYKVFQSATFSSGGAKIRYAYMGKDEDGLIFAVPGYEDEVCSTCFLYLGSGLCIEIHVLIVSLIMCIYNGMKTHCII